MGNDFNLLNPFQFFGGQPPGTTADVDYRATITQTSEIRDVGPGALEVVFEKSDLSLRWSPRANVGWGGDQIGMTCPGPTRYLRRKTTQRNATTLVVNYTRTDEITHVATPTNSDPYYGPSSDPNEYAIDSTITVTAETGTYQNPATNPSLEVIIEYFDPTTPETIFDNLWATLSWTPTDAVWSGLGLGVNLPSFGVGSILDFDSGMLSYYPVFYANAYSSRASWHIRAAVNNNVTGTPDYATTEILSEDNYVVANRFPGPDTFFDYTSIAIGHSISIDRHKVDVGLDDAPGSFFDDVTENETLSLPVPMNDRYADRIGTFNVLTNFAGFLTDTPLSMPDTTFVGDVESSYYPISNFIRPAPITTSNFQEFSVVRMKTCTGNKLRFTLSVRLQQVDPGYYDYYDYYYYYTYGVFPYIPPTTVADNSYTRVFETNANSYTDWIVPGTDFPYVASVGSENIYSYYMLVEQEITPGSWTQVDEQGDPLLEQEYPLGIITPGRLCCDGLPYNMQVKRRSGETWGLPPYTYSGVVDPAQRYMREDKSASGSLEYESPDPDSYTDCPAFYVKPAASVSYSGFKLYDLASYQGGNGFFTTQMGSSDYTYDGKPYNVAFNRPEEFYPLGERRSPSYHNEEGLYGSTNIALSGGVGSTVVTPTSREFTGSTTRQPESRNNQDYTRTTQTASAGTTMTFTLSSIEGSDYVSSPQSIPDVSLDEAYFFRNIRFPTSPMV